MSKFETRDQYLEWCKTVIETIHICAIAQDTEGIKQTIDSIKSKLHCNEGEELYG